MFAVYAESFDNDNPLNGLVVGERPDPEVPDGWTTVTVKAASINHHDVWSLKGVGLPEEAGGVFVSGGTNGNLSALVTAEPDAAFDYFDVAPRVFLNLADLPATGLLQEGSRAAGRLYRRAALSAERVSILQRFASSGSERRMLVKSAVKSASAVTMRPFFISVLIAGSSWFNTG